jgi:hypothetical protein
MNYFAHATQFLDRPYFVAGAAVPDWLMVADRKVRMRSKHVEPFCKGPFCKGPFCKGPFCGDCPDFCVSKNGTAPLDAGIMTEVAAGVLQHLRDDARFHATRAFAETSLALTVRARDALGGETGLRPSFLGHLLVEVLLDAALIAEAPGRLIEYYRVLDEVDAGQVEAAVNRMTPRPTERLALFIELFRRERVLWDYLEDDRLMVRLGQVMRRVRLDDLPKEFAAILPGARTLVTERKDAMLEKDEKSGV